MNNVRDVLIWDAFIHLLIAEFKLEEFYLFVHTKIVHTILF